jgi:3-oxoacyl-[acyl-carrier-protein] synthase-3
MAYLSYANYTLPPYSQSIDDFVRTLQEEGSLGDRNAGEVTYTLKEALGISKVYISSRENELGLFSDLLERYFLLKDIQPSDIGYLIYARGDSIATGDPWSLVDDTCINVPYHLLEDFQMTQAQVFNIEQECTSTLMALKIADSLIKTDPVKKILILSRNFFTENQKRLMGGSIVVSDGAGIIEISAESPGLELIDFMSYTSGRINMVRGLTNAQNMEEVFSNGVGLINHLLNKNHIQTKDIAWIIPQNLSKASWNLYSRMLHFPRDRVFLNNLSDGGHIGDVDFVRNIADLTRQQLARPGDLLLVYGIGTGTSWNAVLLKYHNQCIHFPPP